MSYIAIDATVGQSHVGHAWRDDHNQVHATVYVSESNATAFFFDSPADARSIAAACTEAAEAMERLEAEIVTATPESPDPGKD